MKMGWYHEAIEYLTRAIAINPRFSDAFYNIAAAYAQIGDKENAASWRQKAVELNPALSRDALKDGDFKIFR